MSVEHNTSVTLRYSVFASIIVVIAGLITYMLDMGDGILWAGILMVIISPLIGVAVTTVSLYIEKDLKWVAVALVLITMSVIGMLLR